MSALRGGLRSARTRVAVGTEPWKVSRPILRFMTSSSSSSSSSPSSSSSSPPPLLQKRPCCQWLVSPAFVALSNSHPPRRPYSVRSLFSSILVHYVDLPPNYTDGAGLPFRRRGDLDLPEVTELFGNSLKVPQANRLLRVLHGRRVAGTLDDPAFFPHTARYSKDQIDQALAYLRRTVPVDELINAGLRAEDELAQIEAAAAAGAEGEEGVKGDRNEEGGGKNTNAAKHRPQSPTERKWMARLYKDLPADDVYGVGAFDVMRARNQTEREERERRQAEAEALRLAEQERIWLEQGGRRDVAHADAASAGDVVSADGSSSSSSSSNLPAAPGQWPPRAPSASIQKWAAAATSPLQEAPSMSAWSRLWPSYAFVAVLLTGGAVAVSLYTPPNPEQRLFSSVSPSTATVTALVAANVAVFVLWRIPPLWQVLNRYLIVVPATPRPLSLLGAVFSHQKPGHLLANAVFLWLIGIRLHDDVGRAAFLETYVASGTLAFLASLTNIVLRNNLHLTTLGASGALYGVATAYFILHKFEGFKILGLPPDPYGGIQGLGFVGLMLGLNLLSLRAEKQAIDVVTHFVGMAIGALFGEAFRLQRDERLLADREQRHPRPFWPLLYDTLFQASASDPSQPSQPSQPSPPPSQPSPPASQQ